MSFSRGKNTLTIPVQLFLENRQRLVKRLRDEGKAGAGSVLVMVGGKEEQRYNTDATDQTFRQESYFHWAFGVQESDCYAAIDVDSGRSILFPPKLPPDYAIWMGKIQPESWFQEKYKTDAVHFHDGTGGGIAEQLKTLYAPKKLLLLRAENTDSGNVLEPAHFPGSEQFALDMDILYPVIADLRVFKTDLELEAMRYASKIANRAHMEIMRHVKPGLHEYQIESLFRHVSYYTGGCRHQGYNCITATGCNGAVLHYGWGDQNNKVINDGDMCLFDMGPEYHCYSSDVTCSFPANGKFTERQKLIYDAVYKANRVVLESAKPGVRWTDMHLLAERVILEELKIAGIVQGDVDMMIHKRVGAIFMPHGLGHFLGLDVHDPAGYLGDALPRSTLPGLKSLRTTRTLHERMVITIEPGCYFIDTLLDRALADPELVGFFNQDRLKEFRGMGGVRLEDDIVIWESGNENMNAELPRTVAEIEEFMANNPNLSRNGAVVMAEKQSADNKLEN